VWPEVQYLCYIVKRYENGSAVFYIGKYYISPYGAILGGPAVHLGPGLFFHGGVFFVAFSVITLPKMAPRT
jgi:hypothetical protein